MRHRAFTRWYGAAANMALHNKIALNLLSHEKTSKGTVWIFDGKRRCAYYSAVPCRAAGNVRGARRVPTGCSAAW